MNEGKYELFCEGAEGRTHLANRSEWVGLPGRDALLVTQPMANRTLADGLDAECQVYDCQVFETEDGPWIRTDGAGACPQCFAKEQAEGLLRLATEADVAFFKGIGEL